MLSSEVNEITQGANRHGSQKRRTKKPKNQKTYVPEVHRGDEQPVSLSSSVNNTPSAPSRETMEHDITIMDRFMGAFGGFLTSPVAVPDELPAPAVQEKGKRKRRGKSNGKLKKRKVLPPDAETLEISPPQLLRPRRSVAQARGAATMSELMLEEGPPRLTRRQRTRATGFNDFGRRPTQTVQPRRVTQAESSEPIPPIPAALPEALPNPVSEPSVGTPTEMETHPDLEDPVIPEPAHIEPVTATVVVPPVESRTKPQRSLSRVIEQAEKPFPAIERRDEKEAETLFIEFISGLVKVILVALLFGIPMILIIDFLLFDAGLEIFGEDNTFKSPEYRFDPRFHDETFKNSSQIRGYVAYQDIWDAKFGQAALEEYPALPVSTYWYLFAVSYILAILTVMLPLIYYGSMYTYTRKKVLMALFLIAPIGILLTSIIWGSWVISAKKYLAPPIDVIWDRVSMPVVMVLMWPWIALKNGRWQWALFKAYIPSIILPLLTLLGAQLWIPFVIEKWSRMNNNNAKTLLLGVVSPVVSELILLPLQSVSVLLWNYHGLVKLGPLLNFIFPISLSIGYITRFLLYQEQTGMLVATTIIVLHVIINRILRVSYNFRMKVFCIIINAITTMLGFFPRKRIFKLATMNEISAVEWRAQLAIQDLILQYVASIGAGVAALMLKTSATLTLSSRVEQIFTFAILHMFADLVFDLAWVFFIGFRAKGLFMLPIIGGWVRRHKRYYFLLSVLSMFSFAVASVAISRTMCLVKLVPLQVMPTSTISYHSFFCFKRLN